jgi:hypothetical protein
VSTELARKFTDDYKHTLFALLFIVIQLVLQTVVFSMCIIVSLQYIQAHLDIFGWKYLSIGTTIHSKIPWHPKLLIQRENALASFWVQRVLVTQPRPSRVMIKHNFLLCNILELKLNHYASGLCWDAKTLSGVAKVTSKPSADASCCDYILAPPSRVWYLNIDPPPRVYFLKHTI